MEYTGPNEFVHLHNHTIYSILDGISLPSQYAKQCYELKYPAMAATEHGNLASVPDMYHSFRQYGIKPIVGCEIYYNDYEPLRQSLTKPLKSVKEEDIELYTNIVRNRHLTVIAKNQKGIENLFKLTTQAYNTGLFGAGRTKYPRIWFDKLCGFKEGLIVLSGCLNGPISHLIRTEHIVRNIKTEDGITQEIVKTYDKSTRLKKAVDLTKKFRSIFGEDYYIELQMPKIPGDVEVFRTLVAIAESLKIKTVLTNDAHYLVRKDFELQKILMAVEQGLTVDSKDLFHVNSSEQFMKSRADLWQTFITDDYHKVGIKQFELMCNNTLEVADKCSELKIDSTPKIPELHNSDEELRKIVHDRLKELGLYYNTEKFLIDNNEVTYKEQADLEVDRFIYKGFSSYFLITRDLIMYGRQKGWPFNPRGSAGGSLVCYLLGISNINPMLWGLSFDRFLSPARGGYLLNTTMQ